MTMLSTAVFVWGKFNLATVTSYERGTLLRVSDWYSELQSRTTYSVCIIPQMERELPLHWDTKLYTLQFSFVSSVAQGAHAAVQAD